MALATSSPSCFSASGSCALARGSAETRRMAARRRTRVMMAAPIIYEVVRKMSQKMQIANPFGDQRPDRQLALVLSSTRQTCPGSSLDCLPVRDDSQGVVETSLPRVLRELFPMNPAVDPFR